MPIIRRPGFWIGVALCVAAGLVMAMRARGPVLSTTVPALQDIEQHVVASGRVWVTTRVQLSAQVAGQVVKVGAAEGQRVRAGELLVQLDDAEARAALARARAAVSQAVARVDQLRSVGAIVATEASRQAEANLVRAAREMARAEELAASGIAAPSAVEEARRALEVARAQRTAAEAQQIGATPSGPDSRLALSALAQAEAELAGATARLAQTRIVARQNGVVLSRAVEPGDMVQPGRTLLVLAADGDTLLVVELDERNLAWVQPNQPARVSADAYPKDSFDAQVAYIAPSVDPDRGSVEVRLQVRNPPLFLKPDMTVSVDLTVARKTQVLTIPTDAIRGFATAVPWVLVIESGRLARKNVALGIRGEGRSEVISGLDAADRVVLSADRTLLPGQRVRVAEDPR